MAANGVNVKMGVSGVSQFKQNLSQAKSAVKTLDAQLSLTEKQFKATGDSQSYMAEKGELLKAKLEKQSQIVENCQKALDQMTKNGVDRASKAYQDMYQQMINAKGAMVDTEQAMNNIAGAAEDADTAVAGMDSGLKQIGDGISYQNVTDALGSITSGMESVMKTAWKLGEALVRNVLGAGSYADELNTTAAQYEISPELLQRMRKTATLIDTDAETILDAKDKMAKNISQGGVTDILEILGLGNVVDMNPEDQFWAIGEALKNWGDEYSKIEYANKIFGRSWRELLPLFNAGREEYEKTNDSWSVLSEEQLNNLDKMDDQYHKLSEEWETFKVSLWEAFSGPLTEGMETLTGLVKELNEYLKTPEGQQLLSKLEETVSALISDLTKIDPEQAIETLKGVFDDIKGGLEWISEHYRDVVTGIEAFIGAWAALKTAQGVTTALQLINGLKWIKANPNISIPGAGAAEAGAGGAGAGAAGSAGAGAATKAGWALGFADKLSLAGVGLVGATVADLFNELLVVLPQAYEKGEQSKQRSEQIRKLYADYISNDIWEALNGYTSVGGENYETDMQRMDAFAERYWNWMNGDFTDTGLEHLLDLLDDAGLYDMFNDAMEQYYSGTGNRADLEDVFGRARQLMEEDMYGTPSWLASPMQKIASLGNLPAEIRKAVETAIGSMSVYLDGQKVGELTAPYVSDELAGSVLND